MTTLARSELENIHNDIKYSKSMTDKHHSEMIAINEHIAAILEKNYDKSDEKIEKQIQPMSFQIN